MNSGIEERLTELWQQLGLSVEEGSISHALLLSYAGALSLLSDEYDGVLADIFADSASTRGRAMLLDLIHADSSTELEAYFASVPCMLTKSGFEAAAGAFTYSVENKTFTFSQTGCLTWDILKSVSAFIRNYLPVYMAIMADGSGLTFDEFEALGLSWQQIDMAALPFSAIDSLKYE